MAVGSTRLGQPGHHVSETEVDAVYKKAASGLRVGGVEVQAAAVE